MKPAGGSLIAFLASRQPFWKADLFNFQFPDFGTALYVTDFDQPISDGVNTYANVGPLVQRTGWSIKKDLDISELAVTLYSTGTDYGSLNIKRAIHGGYFDNANLTLRRCIMPTPGDTSLGIVDMFYGVGGKVNGGARGVQCTFQAKINMLQQYMPKNRYMTGCVWSLYSPGCTINRASYTFSAAVDTFIPPSSVAPSGIAWVSDPTGGLWAHLPLGYIVFTSGACAGEQRGISSSNSFGVFLNYPLYNTPVPGDTFTVTMGCDRTQGANGCTFFNNLQHYRGFPFIPPAEKAVAI